MKTKNLKLNECEVEELKCFLSEHIELMEDKFVKNEDDSFLYTFNILNRIYDRVYDVSDKFRVDDMIETNRRKWQDQLAINKYKYEKSEKKKNKKDENEKIEND